MLNTVRKGQCHCGAVRFEANLPQDLKSAVRCNCSYCRMKGAVIISSDEVKLIKGKEELTVYRFHTKSVEHYFCSHCGIYTHHQKRSDPTKFGVNAACLEGVSPFDFADLVVKDGVNHPNDNNGKARIAGHLRYFPENDD